jgi:hypothetical protein
MTNRQIQPVRGRDIQIIRQARPRSLWGQVWNVALQPNTFFLALPQAPSSSRQWFWVAVLILALNGFSAVRQADLASGGGGSTAAPIIQQPSDFSGQGGLSGGGAIQPGGFPGASVPDLGAVPSTDSSGSTSDISSTWVTALISATTILVGWFILAVILCEVPLFNGVRPSFNTNLQIAIWTTVPLGIMAGIQVIYMAGGGRITADGISGLLAHWKGYDELSPFIRSVLLSLTSRLTIFWLWSLVLIYIGGRNALNGRVWAVALVVVIWVLILVFVPVLTGAIAAPSVANSEMPEPITLPSDSGISPEATLSEADAFSTLLPSAGGGDIGADVTSEPNNDEVLPTLEGGGDVATLEGDGLQATAQPNTDITTPAASELATATP